MSYHFSDQQVRLAAFEWLRQRCDQLGDVLTRSLIAKGFEINGVRIPLVGPQGIFKPKVLESIPISITTTTKGPYPDSFLGQGFFHTVIEGLILNIMKMLAYAEALRLQRPLIYFLGVVPGRYLPVWPVYIVNDHPEALSFEVAVDDAFVAEQILRVEDDPFISDSMIARRKYITSNVKVRIHQSTFREKVLKAYRNQCALCRLKHVELLDAAHIIPDAEAGGEPLVENGLSLCKLHHAAFDRYFLGIRPDYTVVLRDDVMHETDGPMLRHGLQGMNGLKLVLPRQTELWPDPDRLAERYDRFCVSV